MTHQEAVAGIDRFGVHCWLRGKVEAAHRALEAAIEDVEEEGASATGRIGRLEDAEIGHEVDAACPITLGLLQVDDRLVGRVYRVHGESSDPVDPLV